MTRFAVLMYHAVSPVSGRLRHLGVDQGLLREQFEVLMDAGYELMSLTEALEAVTLSSSRRPVALTFDDAYADFHASVLPILDALRARATVYVPTMYVGRPAGWLGRRACDVPSLMSWAQLQDCADTGRVEIGSHSHSHRCLDTLHAATVKQEMRDSKQALEARLQSEVRSFCYPHGYHNGLVRSEARDAGYDSACEIGRRLRSSERRMRISRLAVGSSHTPERLLSEVRTGGPVAVPSAKRGLQPAWRMFRRQRTRLRVAR